MKQNKDIRITVRLTPEQYESIRARAETAQMTPSAYIRAAAITRPHSDRKALRREREKKIAMGHRSDDHEEEQGPNLAL